MKKTLKDCPIHGHGANGLGSKLHKILLELIEKGCRSNTPDLLIKSYISKIKEAANEE